MKTSGGVLSDLHRRPWARALAGLCLLLTTGCTSVRWLPVPSPVDADKTLEVRVPAEHSRYRHIIFAHPLTEGDSILFGTTLKGGTLGDSPSERVWTARVRIQDAQMAERKFSAPKTVLLIAGIAAVVWAASFQAAMDDWNLDGLGQMKIF